jgi:hypothetical protein
MENYLLLSNAEENVFIPIHKILAIYFDGEISIHTALDIYYLHNLSIPLKGMKHNHYIAGDVYTNSFFSKFCEHIAKHNKSV